MSALDKIPGSFSAPDWAEAFNEVLVSKGEKPLDEGWLIGWFANAIMRGYDDGIAIQEKRVRDYMEREIGVITKYPDFIQELVSSHRRQRGYVREDIEQGMRRANRLRYFPRRIRMWLEGR